MLKQSIKLLLITYSIFYIFSSQAIAIPTIAMISERISTSTATGLTSEDLRHKIANIIPHTFISSN